MGPRKHRETVNMAKDFKYGALVWAKMKGFSPWPAQVSFPSDGKIPKSKKPQHYVFFFGTNDFAWIPDQHIVPHSEDMLANSRRYKKISSSMRSAIFEIEDASKNVKLLTKDKIKKEPVSSPPPLESIPEQPKAPKRKRIAKKILKPKVLIRGGTRKIKLLGKDKIKKEAGSSSPPAESTPEKSNSRKRKRTSKIMKPTRVTQRCGKKITLLKKDKIKKELVSSTPLPESTHTKSKTTKRKPKMMKPERMTKRCEKLREDKIKKELISSTSLPGSTPKTIKRKPQTMKPERMTKRCEKLRDDKIKKELVSSTSLPESTSKTIKRKPQMMKPERMTKRCEKLREDKIKKELVSSTSLPESTSKTIKRKPQMMKPERMTKRCEKLKKDKIKKELISPGPLPESTPKKRKSPPKKPKMMKSERMTKRCENLIKNKIKKEVNSLPLSKSSPKKPKSKYVPKKNIEIRKCAKKRSAAMMSEYVNKDMNIKKDEDSDDDYSLLIANLPPNNGYSNVAVIPPYNDDSKPTIPSCHREELPDPGTSGDKKFTVLNKKIGFLGIGDMGYLLVHNLITYGYEVTIWNRSISEKHDRLVEMGAKAADCPAEVIQECDIIFSCVSDSEATKNVIFHEFGVLVGLNGSSGDKAYVELSTIDPETSRDNCEAILSKGGKYLEAQMIGTRQDISRHNLVILASGDRGIFDECDIMFPIWCKKTLYMGFNAGHAINVKLIFSMLVGTSFAALGESLSLVDQCELSPVYFMDILKEGPLKCHMLMEKGRVMTSNDDTVYTPIRNQQKDLALAVSLGDSAQQPLALATAANEVFKRAKSRFGDSDVSAIHKYYM